MRFKRLCKRCGKMFNPMTKHGKICDNCKKSPGGNYHVGKREHDKYGPQTLKHMKIIKALKKEKNKKEKLLEDE